MRASLSALEDPQTGCSAWRALSLPEDPIEPLLPLLKPEMRVLVLTHDAASSTLFSLFFSSHRPPPEATSKGAAEPPPQLASRVARSECSSKRLRTLLTQTDRLKGLITKGALSRSKVDSQPPPEERPTSAAMVGAGGEAGTLTRALVSEEEGCEEEEAILALVEAMGEVFRPLLKPMGEEISNGTDPITGAPPPPLPLSCRSHAKSCHPSVAHSVPRHPANLTHSSLHLTHDPLTPPSASLNLLFRTSHPRPLSAGLKSLISHALPNTLDLGPILPPTSLIQPPSTSL